MSVTVTRDITGRRFILKLQGDRKKYKAENADQLMTALLHYFRTEPEHTNLKKAKGCPLCDAIDAI